MTRGRLLLALHSGLLLIASAAAGERCHIHAPDDYPRFSTKPLIIPSVGDAAACERINNERFGGRGRCHCSTDAAPFGKASRRPALDMEQLP